MKIFCDNTGAIALAKESRFHKRTKHIKRCFNSIRDQDKEGDIEICKIQAECGLLGTRLTYQYHISRVRESWIKGCPDSRIIPSAGLLDYPY